MFFSVCQSSDQKRNDNKRDLILSQTELLWIYIRIILLSVGLVSRGHGFHFIHSRVKVLDVLWGVQTSRVVVLVSHHFGAKGKSAPVVAGADVFHFLSTQSGKSWTAQFSKSKRWAQESGICETRMPPETCKTQWSKPSKTFICSGGWCHFTYF